MPIEVDETWLPIFDGEACKRVLRDGFVIGRIKRLQARSEGDLIREWFTAEQMIEGRYILADGTHQTFREALERIMTFSVTELTHPPADPQPVDVVARELHEHARRRIESFPAWEDLDMSDPWHAGLIRLAYDRAPDFIAMSGRNEEYAAASHAELYAPPTRSAPRSTAS